MTRRVLRYDVESGRPAPVVGGGRAFTLTLPAGAEVLALQRQPSKASKSLWVLADPNGPASEERTFLVHTTGHDLPDAPRRYVATLQFLDGRHAEHWFEVLTGDPATPQV